MGTLLLHYYAISLGIYFHILLHVIIAQEAVPMDEPMPVAVIAAPED